MVRVIFVLLILVMIGVASSFSTSRKTPRNLRLFSSTDNVASAGAGSLDGCVCVVTGASRGIGKGIAIELGKEGATVYVTGTSSSSKNKKSRDGKYATNDDVGGPGTVEETAEMVSSVGGKGIPVVCNHANDEEVRSLFEQVEKEQGRLDIVINNAFRVPPGGPSKLFGKFWEQGIDIWDLQNTIGPRSHFVASFYAVPLMLKSRNVNGGSKLKRPFVGMISSFGGLSYTFNLPYGVAKAAVDRLAKDMAYELRHDDFCVTSFYPGVVMTERTEKMVNNGDWDEFVGLPLDIAETPNFTGRAVVAVATDPNNIVKSGSFQVVAELAQEYGFSDVDGSQPLSIRSLKFLLPTYGFDKETREKVPDWMIPDWKLPFWVMAGGKPPESE